MNVGALSHHPATMPPFVEKWTATEREAVATAAVDRGIRPYKRICAMAKAGELTLDGETLPPFDMPVPTVADLARKLRKRRAGEAKTSLSKQAPRDAVEGLRRRLVALADRELEVLERKPRGTVQPEQLRQIVRVVRELAALPGPTDARPVKPGQRDPETTKHVDGATRSGLAGAILQAHGRSGPAQDTPQTKQRSTEQAKERSGAERDGDTEQSSDDEGSPGTEQRALVSDVLGALA